MIFLSIYIDIHRSQLLSSWCTCMHSSVLSRIRRKICNKPAGRRVAPYLFLLGSFAPTKEVAPPKFSNFRKTNAPGFVSFLAGSMEPSIHPCRPRSISLPDLMRLWKHSPGSSSHSALLLVVDDRQFGKRKFRKVSGKSGV